MNLLRSIKSKITEDKNGEILPHLEITEAILVHCNIANNDYQQHSRVFYILVPNKSFSQLLDILYLYFIFYIPKNFIFSKKLLTENFHILKYGLLLQSCKPLEIEDKISINLVFN